MNNVIQTSDVIRQMEWRYATKQFDDTATIPQEQLDTIIEAMRLAPSSFGFQPWRFFVIESDAVKESLGNAAPMNKSKIDGASHFLILARMKTVSQEYIDNYIELMRTTRGQSKEAVNGFHQMVSAKVASMSEAAQDAWTARQVYVALGSAISAAAMIGVDSCPMEGIDPEAFDKILGLEDSDYTTTVGLALGRRDESDAFATLQKIRFAKDDVVQVV